MSHDEQVVNLDSRLSESLNLTGDTDDGTIGVGHRNGYQLNANNDDLASTADNKKSTHPLGTLFSKNSTCHIHANLHSANMNGGETEAMSEAGGRTMSEASTHLSQQSKSSQTESVTTGAAQSSSTGSGIRHSTKVYYHIDEEPTPYCTEVRVSPDKITLGDFKRVLNRSNFKYHYKGIDPLLGGEVKNEILDDCQLLSECRSSNGQFELFLLTVEGSTHSDETSSGFSKHQQAGRYMVPGPAPSSYYLAPHRPHHKQYFDSGHRHRAPAPPFEDSTIYTESEARLYSDDESRVSSSTERVTSVSQQHLYRRRNRRQYHRRQPSRASSMSSMTEMSMQLNVVTVTLNIDTVTFLGISIVGQTCTRGDNGIYVADVMPGGAVALDGRIEPGDMILQVNDVSFENLSNDQAVDVLKQAMEKKGPLKLMVAKCFDGMKSNNFFAAAREPVRPIDTQAWVQHTNAVRGMGIGSGMNSIPEGSEGAPTPIPGQYPTSVGGGPLNGPMMAMGMPQHSAASYNNHHMLGLPGFSGAPTAAVGRPASSSTATSNGSGGGGGGTMVGQPGPSGGMFMMHPSINAQAQTSVSPLRLDVNTDKKTVLQAMALPNSGLDIHNRKWLKIVFPMSFLGSDLVHWLFDNVEGLRDRKEARKYASELLKQRFIEHVVNKTTFSEQCYYVFAKEYSDFLKYRKGEGGGGPPNQQQAQQQQQQTYHHLIHQQQLPPPHLLPQMMPPPGGGGGGGPQYLPTNSQGGMWIPGHQQQPQQHVARSLVSEYASMPPVASPYPPGSYIPHSQPQSGRMMGGGGMYVTAANVMLPGHYGQQQQQQTGLHQQQNLDHHSQANSNNSNDGGGTSSGGGSSSDQHNRRKAVLPPAPSLSSSMPAGGIPPPPPSQQLCGMKSTNGGPPPPSSHFFSTQLHQPHRHHAAAEGTTYAGEDFFLQHL